MKITYIKTNLKTIVNISKIVMIHYYEFDRNFVFSGEAHDFWELVYVDRGAVEIKRDEETIVLRQGELVFHKPNEFHSIRALDSSPNFFVISFVCDSAAMDHFVRYETKLDASLKPYISSIIKEAKAAYSLKKNDPYQGKLIRRSDAPVGAEHLIKLYLEQLLVFLVRSITDGGKTGVFPNKESMETHLVVAVKQLIAEHIYEPFSVSALCATLGYSKSYLSKIFRLQSGSTIADYAREKKIERAKELIREGIYNFTEISDRLAFDNPQYFSRVFKRMTGLTPTEFRRSLAL